MRAQSNRLKLFIHITVDVIKSYECTTDKCNKIPRAMGGNMLLLNTETLLTSQLKNCNKFHLTGVEHQPPKSSMKDITMYPLVRRRLWAELPHAYYGNVTVK